MNSLWRPCTVRTDSPRTRIVARLVAPVWLAAMLSTGACVAAFPGPLPAAGTGSAITSTDGDTAAASSNTLDADADAASETGGATSGRATSGGSATAPWSTSGEASDSGATTAARGSGSGSGSESRDLELSSGSTLECLSGTSACTGVEACTGSGDGCTAGCDVDPDVDGDGEDDIACGGLDCDDRDPAIHPSAVELCDADQVDEDCDPSTTEDDFLGQWWNCAACGDTCGVRAACEDRECIVAMRVFVTSEAFTGALGGLLGADARCQSIADDAELEGTWRAFIVDSTQGLARHNQLDVPYVRLDGVRIADNFDDLRDGSILNTLNVTETGASVGGNAWVGAGNVDTGMSTSGNCDNWTSEVAGCGEGPACGYAGEIETVDTHWDGFFVFDCSSRWRLYCIEQ